MERTIMVANTKTQKRYKITTNANTLGELKQTLAANGIDYSDMSFTEGISKTTLLEDSTPLPANVPYKGNTTNNLVILLTNTRKNIASGMSRTEAYEYIKDNGLQDKVEEAFGRNYTQVSTSALETFIANQGGGSDCGGENGDGKRCRVTVEEIPTDDRRKKIMQEKADSISSELDDISSSVDDICDDLDGVRDSIDSLMNKIASLRNCISGDFSGEAAKITDSDIDDMMASM